MDATGSPRSSALYPYLQFALHNCLFLLVGCFVLSCVWSISSTRSVASLDLSAPDRIPLASATETFDWLLTATVLGKGDALVLGNSPHLHR